MVSKFWLLSALTRLAISSPVAQNGSPAGQQQQIQVEPQKNFYIEPDLDVNRPYTADARFSIVKYGPQEVPAMGMIDNMKIFNQAKPCDECYVTAMQADLQYPNGTIANINTGGWLHHIVLYTGLGWTPGSKKDLICSYTLLSGFMGWPHRIFASGNERTPVRLNHRYKFGIPIDKDEVIHILMDLVNTAPYAQSFNVVVTYEWVPKNATGYRPARLLWTDVTGCGTSEAPAQEGVYELKSPGWVSTIGGVMLATLGHVHDGGIYTSLYVNNKVVCQSDQFYGTKPAFFETPGMVNLNAEEKEGMNHGNMGGDHGSMGGDHGSMPMASPQPPAQPPAQPQALPPAQQPQAPQPQPELPAAEPYVPAPQPQQQQQPPQTPSPGVWVQPNNNNPDAAYQPQQPQGNGWQQPQSNGWQPQSRGAQQPQGNGQSQPQGNGWQQPNDDQAAYIWRTVPIKYNDNVHQVQRNGPLPPLEISGMTHVSESSSCINFGVLNVGDNVVVGATYDSKAHFQNRNHMHEGGGFLSMLGLGEVPKYAPIMGINPFYIGEGQMTLD